MTKFNDCIQEGDRIIYNEDLDCKVNVSQLQRVAKRDTNLKKKIMKLWIGRTEADIPDDVYESVVERHPERRIYYTKLYVFYDKPHNMQEFEEVNDARIMCEVPSYMFPKIKELECVEFVKQ